MKNFFILIGFTYIGVSHLFAKHIGEIKALRKPYSRKTALNLSNQIPFLIVFSFVIKKNLEW